MNEFGSDFQDEDEIEIEAVGVEVDSQPIELYKVLKIADAVSGGGEAKYAITEGYVAVNGEIETRKRRKLYDGDLIEFNQEFYLVICDAPPTEAEVKAKPVKLQPEKAIKNKQEKKKKTKPEVAKTKNKPEIKAKPKKMEEETKPDEKIGGRGSIKFF
ncbi:RNA-binding S4 domain-containing protein [Vibrio ziniensis]|uniref:RNA-binding S4 domain-containing protein n=1 Tax=Vibrio ziniensis TaxID=2711221 RepID=A0A6G7CQL9_9VIBR|nr:RNA-binding S4 domain-containing protein [Vibrio ziniensis]QIH44353.1 RNA-binding S4 domain-containing protein [Vibrio ziniensis]